MTHRITNTVAIFLVVIYDWILWLRMTPAQRLHERGRTMIQGRKP